VYFVKYYQAIRKSLSYSIYNANFINRCITS